MNFTSGTKQALAPPEAQSVPPNVLVQIKWQKKKWYVKKNDNKLHVSFNNFTWGENLPHNNLDSPKLADESDLLQKTR